MRRSARWTLGLVAGALLGCASAGAPRSVRIEIVTDPPGATVTGADQTIRTPGKIRLSVPDRVELRVEKDGFWPESVALRTSALGLSRPSERRLDDPPKGGAGATSGNTHDPGDWLLVEAIIGAQVLTSGGAAIALDGPAPAARMEGERRILVRLTPLR